MAKLKDHKFYMKSVTDEELHFTSVVTVDGEGWFHLTIPDELEDVARAVNKQGTQCSMTRPRKSLRISGPSLETQKRFYLENLHEHWDSIKDHIDFLESE